MFLARKITQLPPKPREQEEKEENFENDGVGKRSITLELILRAG